MNPRSDSYDWDFFIAHAGPDKSIAEQLYDRLERDSRPFVDSKSLQLGDDWDLVLRDAQKRSLVTVVLISSRTDKAYYQREEIAAAIALARSNEEHRVVPIYLDGEAAASNSVPYGLRLKQGIVLSDSVSLGDVHESLLKLKDHLERPKQSQLRKSTKPQPDLAMIVGVETRTEDPGKWPETFLNYCVHRRDDLIKIVPSMPYLDTYKQGGPIEKVGFNWDLPNLDFKIVNNSNRTVFLTEVCFNIEYSRLDPFPLLVVMSDHRIPLKFRISNDGWGHVTNCQAKFHLTPFGRSNDTLELCDSYPHEVRIDDFLEDIIVDISSAFEEEGLNLTALRSSKERFGSYIRLEDLGEEILEDLDPFRGNDFLENYGAIVTGELIYKYIDGRGKKREHKVKFSTYVYIFYSAPNGMMLPPTYQYATKFDVDRANYLRSVEISHVLKPGEADRFTIKIGTNKSSIHSFTVSLLHNAGQVLESQKIELTTFVPRLSAKSVEDEPNLKPVTKLRKHALHRTWLAFRGLLNRLLPVRFSD